MKFVLLVVFMLSLMGLSDCAFKFGLNRFDKSFDSVRKDPRNPFRQSTERSISKPPHKNKRPILSLIAESNKDQKVRLNKKRNKHKKKKNSRPVLSVFAGRNPAPTSSNLQLQLENHFKTQKFVSNKSLEESKLVKSVQGLKFKSKKDALAQHYKLVQNNRENGTISQDSKPSFEEEFERLNNDHGVSGAVSAEPFSGVDGISTQQKASLANFYQEIQDEKEKEVKPPPLKPVVGNTTNKPNIVGNIFEKKPERRRFTSKTFGRGKTSLRRF